MSELTDIFTLDFQAHLQGPALLAALVAIGFMIGILTGLFGVGGGFLINPLLIVLLGMQETLVVGSSLSFTIGTAAAGTARHWRKRNVEIRTALILVAFALPGVWLGEILHVGLRETLGEHCFSIAFMAFYLTMLLVTAWIVFRNPEEHSGKSMLQRMPFGPRVDLPGAGREGTSLVGMFLVGMGIGLAKGMLGIGGGVLFVPLLMIVVGVRTHLAVGTSLGIVLCSSIFGTLLYGRTGNVNLSLVMILLVGSAAGVQLGAWICECLHAGKLRRYFVYVVLAAAALTAYKLVGDIAFGNSQ